MEFSAALQQVLSKFKSKINDISLRSHQLDAFEHLWEDKGDMLLCLPTGYGKSLIYQLAAPLLRLRDNRDSGSVIVISPLNMIHLDQLSAMKCAGIKCCKLDVEGKAQLFDNDEGFIGDALKEAEHSYDDDDSVSQTDQVIMIIFNSATS